MLDGGCEAAGVDAGILGYHMYKNDREFKGSGTAAKGAENTIAGIGAAREGDAPDRPHHPVHQTGRCQ